jgi:hypothetical protein
MYQRQGLVVGIITMFIVSVTIIDAPVSAQAQWTVLVYMAGDNNLEREAIDDINEMEIAGSSPDVNIVVQIDRIGPQSLIDHGYAETTDDTSNGNWMGTRRYLIAKDSKNEVIVSNLLMDMGEHNMADPNTLIKFVTWGINNYKAAHYALILWDHGGGYTGLNWDYTSNTHMTMPELRGALATITYEAGKKMDVIGFDMCYMAAFEVDYQIAPYASIRIASEENDPNDGWEYSTLLSGLIANPTMSPSAFSELSVTTFLESRTDGEDDPFDANFVTLSSVDLAGYPTLVTASDAFVNSIKSLPRETILQAATDADFYGSSELGLSGRYTDFIDFSDFASQINMYTSTEMGTALIDALGSSVIVEKHGTFHDPPGASKKSITGSNGISIYLPKGKMDLLYPAAVRFGEDFHWADLLAQLYGLSFEEGAPTLIITSLNVTTTSEKIIIRGFTGSEYVVNSQIFRNIVSVGGKVVPVNSSDGTFVEEVSLSCGVNTVQVSASNARATTTQTVTATRTCASQKPAFLTVNLNATMQSPARLNVIRTDALRIEAGELMKEAEGRNLPIEEIGQIMTEADALLKKARGFLVGRNFIAANNFAMRASEKYKLAIDMLKALLT